MNRTRLIVAVSMFVSLVAALPVHAQDSSNTDECVTESGDVLTCTCGCDSLKTACENGGATFEKTDTGGTCTVGSIQSILQSFEILQDPEYKPDNQQAKEPLAVPDGFVRLPEGALPPPPNAAASVAIWLGSVACRIPEVEELSNRYAKSEAPPACAADADNGTACTENNSACLCFTDDACQTIAAKFDCGFCEDGYCYGYNC